jgi:SAM-dependent methyltransferase
MAGPTPRVADELKLRLARTPIVGSIVRSLARMPAIAAVRRHLRFRNSASYWEERYAAGGTSGAGSYGRLAAFKAEILNDFVATERVGSVVEFGCGDGAQLALARYPDYVGVDVAQTSIALCRKRFADDPRKRFHLAGDLPPRLGPFDLALSLDVLYHLVEDTVFDAYMRQLFDHGRRYVAIYASNTAAAADSPHVRHRHFTPWIEAEMPGWRLYRHVPNRFPFDPARPDETSFADFYFFHRAEA